MKNVTEYLKNQNKYSNRTIQSFKRMQRVKYLLASGEKIEVKRGRYKGYTLFSDRLFSIFLLWIDKKPVPLLNRMEYEVNDFICEFFGDETIRQYRLNGFIYDWYIPSWDLLIEFNEKGHNRSKQKIIDSKKQMSNLYIVSEKTVMSDLAKLVKNIIKIYLYKQRHFLWQIS